MIIKNKYPICEFDTNDNAKIRASDFLEKSLPKRCVITFFRKELEEFVSEKGLPIIGKLHSEVVDLPIYGYGDDLSGEKWDSRCWDKQFGVRRNLIEISLKLVNRI